MTGALGLARKILSWLGSDNWSCNYLPTKICLALIKITPVYMHHLSIHKSATKWLQFSSWSIKHHEPDSLPSCIRVKRVQEPIHRTISEPCPWISSKLNPALTDCSVPGRGLGCIAWGDMTRFQVNISRQDTGLEAEVLNQVGDETCLISTSP